ncbi:hypothetical protein G4D61_16385 [Bacillus ginsengihumi]|uniref:Replication-associated protein ORF2/G2P domain-containing protein n=1 Tax=Heyndrickxia ginsengihumi TaxID=363870 RepID=A0A6M0PBX9_9BACI|nr:hypothetical protein [Heyndrickxia ginsengihumi]NEY21520.1 hypothetical protein [Heyndrickxia ginsengihumi]
MTNYVKATISNRLVEITQQSNFPFMNNSYSRGRKPATNLNSDQYYANVKKSINRARKQIRRLLECNFTDEYAFVTLTFRKTSEFDITNIKTCHQKFAEFKKRLDYYLQKHGQPKFKYLGVIEFQDKNRHGAIHYHLVCNLINITNEELESIWTYGWANKKNTKSDIEENEKIANYLKKGITDPRLNGMKKYFHSHGLKSPITLEIDNLDEFYDALDKCQTTLLEGDTYHSAFLGETKYENYYVENAKELMEYVQDL